MLTYERIAAVAAVGITLFAAGGARAFEGAPSKKEQSSAYQAFQTGARAYMAGDKAAAVTSLLDAARLGHAMAQWKLARMYAEGDGVDRDDVKAFDYFTQVANAHADDEPYTDQSRFVANSFVALGNYYLDGIPNSQIKPDAARAREMFSYAASYFGDPDAQYNLARMYIDGPDGEKDPRQAARWLGLAANKGQREAQAVLGHMLFNGLQVPRQRARGLMWLTLANAAAGPNDKWIGDLYREAEAEASAEDQETAQAYVAAWNKDR
ncbi:tetratricopeptide repeat protein [Hansschlegelia plantiphila]|uniref:Exopolysaccharide production negative regulator n=1 Tax=Hansschlegelia plantiphila TaxID=374655 RepID=A0A9W6J1H2_9HYPH|nr:tetratricopeptide repeat protein [Hansschlegelia plantiphila]GLK67559.1 exopolysaccharide production negative regulator [Hansschlegelia plantiphila]